MMLNCKYRTRENGELYHPNACPKRVKMLYEAKIMTNDLVEHKKLDDLIAIIEEKIFEKDGTNFEKWIVENEEQLKKYFKDIEEEDLTRIEDLDIEYKRDYIRYKLKVIVRNPLISSLCEFC